MNDAFVFETTHDLNHRVRFANGVQELIAHPFALRRTTHQARDVDKLDAGRNDYLSLHQFGERREPFIRNRYHAHVRLAGRKGIVRDQPRRLRRHSVEKGRLSDVG